MDAKKTWEITERMIQGQFIAKDGKLVGSGTGGFNLVEPSASEYASFMQSTKAWKKKRRDYLWEKEENGTLTPAEKAELKRIEKELSTKDDSPIKTGGTVQRELEERQMAGWARRSGGKQPGWYVYQDGQSYAGPYYSRAEGEEGLRLANRLHPGHKYDLRVIGTRDAKDADIGNPFIPHKHLKDFSSEEKAQEFVKLLKSQGAKNIATSSDRDRLNNRTRYLVAWDASPMEMLRAVNEAQKALQRAEKGSAEYNAAKKKLDALVAEMAKANRAFEAAGGKYKRSTEGQANRANADSAVFDKR